MMLTDLRAAQYLRLTKSDIISLPPGNFSLINPPINKHLGGEEDSVRSQTVFTTLAAFPEQWLRTIRAETDDSDAPRCSQNMSFRPYLLPASDLHIRRVLRHASAMGVVDNGIPNFSKESLRRITTSLAENILTEIEHQHSLGTLTQTDSQKENSRPMIRIRIVFDGMGAEVFGDAFIHPWNNLETIDLVSFNGERELPQIKLATAKTSRAARAFAEEQAKSEALLVDRNGKVTEGAWSNLFWFDAHGRLFHPIESTLPGVIKQSVEKCRKVHFRSITVKGLLEEASEIFVTQSTKPITRVLTIDGREPKGRRKLENTDLSTAVMDSPLTDRLETELKSELLEGAVEIYPQKSNNYTAG